MSDAAREVPDAVVVRVDLAPASRGRPAVRTVVVDCPFGCGRRHTHGWPPGAGLTVLRVSHCAPSRGTYRLVVPQALAATR